MLAEEEIQKIRLVLYSDGWNHVMKPLILKRGRSAIGSLTLTRAERAKEFKGTDFDTEDDVLRAMIRDCEWMASCWDNEVRVHDANRRNDELAANGVTP